MNNNIISFISRHGLGLIMGATALDGYRRTVINDMSNKTLDTIDAERIKLEEREGIIVEDQIKLSDKKTKIDALIAQCKEALDTHKVNQVKLTEDNSNYHQAEFAKSKEKVEKAYKNLKEANLGTHLKDLYEGYLSYLENLNSDKIVCLFNIIMGGLSLSSFLTVLSILLSESIINRIEIFNNYPRLLKLLKIRSNINKKITKFYLFIHVFTLFLTFLANVYMFLL